nr:hypothetical protein [Tanacetum cinerariifolium]
MDLLAFIYVADPPKVRVVERERVEGEVKLLDSTVGRVVPLLPVALARAKSELKASVNKLFNEGGSADQGNSATGDAAAVTAERQKRHHKKRPAVVDSSDSSHPPKKLRGDHVASSEVATGGKSPSTLRELLASSLDVVNILSKSSLLNVEAGVKAVAMPFVTSSVSATPEREDDNPTNTITGANLHSTGPAERFVISPDSSHHSSTHAFGVEVAYIIRFCGDGETRCRGSFSSSWERALLGSREVDYEHLHEVFIPRWNISNDALLDDLDTSREFFDHLAPSVLFSKIYDMDYEQLFTEFNVGTARQVCLNAKDLELKDLNVALSSLRSQNDRLVDQVHVLETTCSGLRERLSGYENLTVRLKEFQDAQLKVVNDKVAKLDADMACHKEEKFYPHLLTIISGRRWLLTHGLKLVLVKCLNSSEYLTALGAAISRAIEKGMQDRLAAGIDHGKERRNLTDVAAYNPSAEVDFDSALQELREIDFPLLSELTSHKDASVEDIMNLLRLEGPLADAPSMGDLQPDIEQLKVPIHRSEDQVLLGETSLSFSLSVSHSRVEQIKANIAAKWSALLDIWTPLSEPLSVQNLIGEASTSASVPTTTITTTAISTTFASGDAATVEFKKEEPDTTSERDLLS